MQITLAYLNSWSEVMSNWKLFLKDTRSTGEVLQRCRSKTLGETGRKAVARGRKKSALLTQISPFGAWNAEVKLKKKTYGWEMQWQRSKTFPIVIMIEKSTTTNGKYLAKQGQKKEKPKDFPKPSTPHSVMMQRVQVRIQWFWMCQQGHVQGYPSGTWQPWWPQL